MAADPQAKHLGRLRRLRASARRWSVTAGTLGAATVVLLPYGGGVGLADVFWAAGAGGATALAWWRWSDHRALAAQPVPPPLDPATRAIANQHRIESLVSKLPIGRSAVAEMHRVAHLQRLRGSQAAPVGSRLDHAVKTLGVLAPRLSPDVLTEARGAELGLRELAERCAAVERALKMPGDPIHKSQLETAHGELVEHLTEGVAAYEGLVAAAASYVAADARVLDPFAMSQLTEASDRLRGVAEGLAEFRQRRVAMPGL
jgi:hypothetical protein